MNSKSVFSLVAASLMSIASFAQTSDAQKNSNDNPDAVTEASTDKAEAPAFNMQTFADRFEFHGYAQAGYTYRDNASDLSTFDIKRVLFWAKAKVTDKWSFLFMHDFSSVVQEFYTDYKFNDGFTVRFGQFKNSFSLENPMSPTKLELIECYSQVGVYLTGCGSDPLFGVQYGRDLGMVGMGNLFDRHLYYELAIMNGQGINRKDGNKDKDLIVKLDYRPVDRFRVVASAQKGRGHAVKESSYVPDVKVGDNYRRDRWSFGFELDGRKAYLRSEIMGGKDSDVDSWGYYFTGHMPVVKNFDVIASYDYVDYNKSLSMSQHNLCAGVQYWFFNKCRAQLQYTRCLPNLSDDYNHIQMQMQVAF